MAYDEDNSNPSNTAEHFADTLIERVRVMGHPLCVGLVRLRRGEMSDAPSPDLTSLRAERKALDVACPIQQIV
jgi:hypothetical protein